MECGVDLGLRQQAGSWAGPAWFWLGGEPGWWVVVGGGGGGGAGAGARLGAWESYLLPDMHPTSAYMHPTFVTWEGSAQSR